MVHTPRFTRRNVIKGSLAATLGVIFAPAPVRASTPLMGFTPVPLSAGKGKMPMISPDYEYQVLIPWGSPLQPDGPQFNYPPRAEDQLQQIGIGHDGMAFFSLGERRGVLAVNHEFGKNPHVLGRKDPENHQHVLASQAAHGMSIVEIAEQNGQWTQQKSRYARRIHINTKVRFSGPAAGDDLLKNEADNACKGTMSNCANGRTPWGTYLTCEENFNLQFGATGQFESNEAQLRYGILGSGGEYGWHLFDPRFDLSDPGYINESNRFGWVVEIDPLDPEFTPVKRTALGRFKHEGVAIVEASDGRILAYMGDDSTNEFIYRYASAAPWREMMTAGTHPLDEGHLSVARFDQDGAGEWLPLEALYTDQQFNGPADVLVHARLAGTALGATPMDRPEWITPGTGGFVYCAMTNNEFRTQSNAANPLAPNPHGHIIRFRDQPGPHGSTQRFTWEVFISCAAHYEKETTLSSPDGLWADPDGRLFVETDGEQRDGMNNQLLVVDTATREIRRLLTGVPGCEITGITTTPDRRTMFINIQHPGNGDPSLTNFPHAVDNRTVPRDCTLAIHRKDGGIVGS